MADINLMAGECRVPLRTLDGRRERTWFRRPVERVCQSPSRSCHS